MTEETKPDPRSDGYAATEPAPELAHARTPRADAVTQEGPSGGDAGASASRQPRFIGRFRIEGQLGSGGMGDVFRAHDPVLDRAVALKVLHAGGAADGTQGMRRVLREARAAAALTHPNTVTIFEVGEAEGDVFIAMELLEGEDLRAVIERGDASLEDKLRWLLEAARALGAAHERGLVHRDVKPENMFVCKGGALKLLDFGIAKRNADEDDASAAADGMGPSSLRTEVGRRVGTPRYMAPEQHAGEATDARTDEYAWALVAFELLTGAHVASDLPTSTSEGGVRASSEGPAESGDRITELRARAPELPASIAEVVARALEPQKEARFSSMAPIVEALAKKFAPSRAPAPAARPSRRRLWLAGAAALVVVAVAGAGVTARLRGDRPGAPPRSMPKALCRVEATRSVPMTVADRITVLPDGRVVIARDFRNGILFEHLTPDGGVPVLRTPFIAAAHVMANDELVVRGTVLEGSPAVALRILQGERGDVVSLFAENQAAFSRRIDGAVTGLVTTPFGKNVAIIVTTARIPPRRGGAPSGTEGHLVTPRGSQRAEIESGGTAEGPAVAAAADVMAVAYLRDAEMHLALLDRNLDRIGDVHRVATSNSYPAVAFAGATVVVYWGDDGGGKTRLHVSTYTPGDAEITEPRMAIDEPLSPKAPVTAKLPNGEWVVAWVAGAGGLSTLRVSPVGAGGLLAGPTEIAKGPDVSSLQATATDKGITYLWHESEHLVRIAEVTCAAH